MFAPIFVIAASSAAVKLLIGSGGVGDPLRLYPFGLAPQGVQLPYVVWRNISGSPLNYLGNKPDTDQFNIQIDVYGSSAESVRAVAEALNEVIETQAHIVRWGEEDRDHITRNYHYDFDVDFYKSRP